MARPQAETDEGYSRRHDEWRTSLTPTLRKRARSMRKAPTEAEQKLWGILRDRRFVDFKFRRQVPIGSYIVDFFCADARLIVELDGSQHAESGYDVQRDAWLASKGFAILRIWNGDLASDRTMVLDAIWHALHPETSPHPPRFARDPLPQGERGGTEISQPGTSLPPLRGKVARPQAGTDEGYAPGTGAGE